MNGGLPRVFDTGLHPVPESLAFQSEINENCLGLSIRGFTNQKKKVKLKEVRNKKRKWISTKLLKQGEASGFTNQSRCPRIN
jgi:hypothetical protein